MQHRNNQIKLRHRTFGTEQAAGICAVKIVVAVDRAHVNFGGAVQKSVDVPVGSNIGKPVACEPAALLAQVHGYDIVFVAIDGGHGLAGRYD